VYDEIMKFFGDSPARPAETGEVRPMQQRGRNSRLVQRAAVVLCALLPGVILSAATATDADLAQIKTVYLLPMSGGLDQYLAVRLTNGKVMEVVTDPKKADAVFTDRIGSNFEAKLDELYAPPKPKDDKDQGDDFVPPVMQPLSAGKGSVFLVNRKTHVVVWSTYVSPKSRQADDMNRVAGTVADRLEKDLKKK
jgi:hypothetical protein